MDTRKTLDAMVFALVAANNERQVDAVSTNFHADTTAVDSTDYQSLTITRVTISSANATDLATSLTLVNELKEDINKHLVDAGSHNTAVSAAVTTATATDEATSVALVNALKAAYNTHLSAAGVHYNNDGTNTVINANATDTTTVLVLANELKADFNAHVTSAPTGAYIQLINA